MQGELFEPAAFVLRPALIGPDGTVPFFAVGCSHHKRTEAAPASELYISDRFRSSISIAQQLGAPHAILSAKHGVVADATVLQPYDLNLTDLPRVEQRRWAQEALEALRVHARGRRITLLASPEYTTPLAELNEASVAPLEIIAPWARLELRDVSVWLVEAQRMATRIRDLDLLYSWIDKRRRKADVFRFRSLAEQAVPSRGVYLFLDQREPNFLGVKPRIVRVGTHAVSLGSKATLRGRLRNHLGPTNEIGNHRGSIFRLHVGRAMLEAIGGHSSLPSWGQGQDADTNTKVSEASHEQAVSRYLQDLEVVLVDVDDEPSKDSLRARVEAQLIALCTESMRPIDCPTADWLGLKSPVASINQSGLWNIRGVGERYDPAGAGAVRSIVEAKNNE